jgi:hypothetical protein
VDLQLQLAHAARKLLEAVIVAEDARDEPEEDDSQRKQKDE